MILHSIQRSVAILMLAWFLITPCIHAEEGVSSESGIREIGTLDIRRVEELYTIMDQIGDSIWPGFDLRSIPIAINNHDREELLIAHPEPSAVYEPCNIYPIPGQKVFIRDGCTRYGPESGGWALDIEGVRSAYVGIGDDYGSTEEYLSLLLHECFHVYQPRFRSRTEGALGELPELNPEYSALLGLECRIIQAALQTEDDGGAEGLARMFVAVRERRRRDLPEEVIRREDEEEFNEGTATYIQAKLFQILSRNKEWRSVIAGEDPLYSGFREAEKHYREYIESIFPPGRFRFTFFHSEYQTGMALCLLLDRFSSDWKSDLSGSGSAQYHVLKRRFPVREDEKAELLNQARERFGYEDILGMQSELVEERVSLLKGYLEKPGRRFRIYRGSLTGGFRWKPAGPVYRVPSSILKEIEEKLNLSGRYPGETGYGGSATVWTGGISILEWGEVTFESKDVPVIYSNHFIEWIDPEPAEDERDVVIESSGREGGVYYDLVLITDGFRATVPAARIERCDSLVVVFPVDGE